MKLSKSNIVSIVLFVIIVVLIIYFRNKISQLVLSFKDSLQHCQQTPQIGELSTGGVIKFQSWVNEVHNLNLNTTGDPDDDTKNAYSEYGREFLSYFVV